MKTLLQLLLREEIQQNVQQILRTPLCPDDCKYLRHQAFCLSFQREVSIWTVCSSICYVRFKGDGSAHSNRLTVIKATHKFITCRPAVCSMRCAYERVKNRRSLYIIEASMDKFLRMKGKRSRTKMNLREVLTREKFVASRENKLSLNTFSQ